MTLRVTPDIRVVVAEDDDDHRRLIERVLRDAGIQVEGVATGEAALEEADGVDLVLVDHDLPGLSGLDTLRAIRAVPAGPSVVMVTATESTELAVEAMRAGAVDYVSKSPGYLEELPGIVERAWRHHDLARRADELQQLALLLHSAEELEGVRERIVDGARRLLRAETVALVEFTEAGPKVHQTDGPRDRRVDALLRRSRADLPAPGHILEVGPRDVVVALPAEPDEPYALLALFALGAPAQLDEEIELATVFASFAAVALRNLRRWHLEQDLVAELQHTIEARRDFVASVSHELRTPLTSINGYAETMLDFWHKIDDDGKREYLTRIRRNSFELKQLVEQLIDIAGIERGQRFQADLEPVDVEAVVRGAIEQLSPLLEHREVEVDVPAVKAVADPALLHRVFANLVSNATKFSPPGTGIEIVGRLSGEWFLVDVVDHGIGLDRREAARVFDPFWRAGSSVSNAIRGSGIGLALVREYLRAMGGEVSVRSRRGHGSTFTCTLKVAADGEAAGSE